MLQQIFGVSWKIAREWWFCAWSIFATLMIFTHFVLPNLFWVSVIYSVATILWGLFIIPFMKKQIWVANKYLREPPMNLFCDVQSAARYDWIEWPQWQLYFGSVFLMLPRMIGVAFI
jgi:hypothetical protein